MKRKRHLRTRILLTLTGLTCAVLLAVALAFNLSVRGFIRSRVSNQLSSVSESISNERHDPKGGKHFDDKPDKITGARPNAALVSESGELIDVLHGDSNAARQIAELFKKGSLKADASYAAVKIESGSYAVSIAADTEQDGTYIVSYIDVTSLTALTTRVNTVLIIVILAAILLSILLSRHFAKSLAEPVQSLSDFARDIGGGDLSPRELDFKEIELSGLADSMNRMARELDASKRRQELFFQNVSHELRTPLTSIRGNAEGIACGVMEPDAAAQVILSETDRLTAMVEEILYISRMDRNVADTGGAGETAEPIDMRELLSLCVSEHRAEAEKRGIRFAFDFDDSAVMFPIKETDGEKLFGNIISNAVRYAKSLIEISCRAEKGTVTATIRDDGAGISENDLPHIFERFYKGEGGKYGIGLAIAKSVANAYHASLEAINDNGAVFTAIFKK
ncbi:MAG: HAMP domain-containing histidine kinase [Clostridia bacterium]|nr:HAMP domain-containing histidine kinase [Clostridia bacterium]